MAASSQSHSSSASDRLIAFLGQELYQDYFGTGEDGGIVVGGASDSDACADESQACAIVDNLLLEACKAYGTFKEWELDAYRNKTTFRRNQKKTWQTLEEPVCLRKPKQTQSIVCACGMNGKPIATP